MKIHQPCVNNCRLWVIWSTPTRSLAHLVACTGSAGCGKGLADTKDDARQLAERLHDQSTQVQVHFVWLFALLRVRTHGARHIVGDTPWSLRPLFSRCRAARFRRAARSQSYY